MNKPCPFCGCEKTTVFKRNLHSDGVHKLHWVDCANVNCEVHFNKGEFDQKEAERKWNTRPIEDALRAENERLKEESKAVKIENMKLRTGLEQIHNDASYSKDYSKFARDLIQITTEALK